MRAPRSTPIRMRPSYLFRTWRGRRRAPLSSSSLLFSPPFLSFSVSLQSGGNEICVLCQGRRSLGSRVVGPQYRVLQKSAVSRPFLTDLAFRRRFVGLQATIPHLAFSVAAVGRWLADGPIFHLVLNWARNLYPYFANTEGAEEGGRGRHQAGTATLARSERRQDPARQWRWATP